MKMYLIGVSLAALCGPAYAQQATEGGAQPQAATPAKPAQAQQDRGGVEDIIVTAQKREENLQNVPIAVTALSSETLLRSGVNSLDAVQRLAPGLSMSTIGSGFVSYTYVRGAGTNQIDSGSDPSVAFFVDEVYIGGNTGLQFDLFDIERIEVLKGPQGTLFGRNAEAGAISVTTRRPSSTPGGMVQIEGGNYGQALLRASLTGPLSADGDWRYRVTGAARHRNAFTHNVAGEDPGKINNFGGRGQIEYDRNGVDAVLSAEYFQSDNGMTNFFLATANPLGYITAAAAATLPKDQSFYRRYYNFTGYERQKQAETSLHVDWDLGGVKLTSISAYRNNVFHRAQDQDGTLADGYVLGTTEHVRQLSQELRLANDGDRFNWIAGLYYYHSHIFRYDYIDTGPDFASVVLQNKLGRDDHNLYTTSYAAFGQATYDLTDQLAFTLGGRFTRDEKESRRTVDRYQLPGPENQYSVDPHASFNSFDPAATINFKPSQDILLYASAKRGFKSGGWQSLLPTRTGALTPFNPEHVVAFEVGLKSDLLDHRLRFNIDAFHATVEDQQILVIPAPTVNIVANAGKTKTYGTDIQISAVPTPRIHLDVNATWQHARFTVFNSLGQNFVGNHALRSPDFSISATAEYVAPLAEWGSLTFRGEYFHQSTIFFDAANNRLFNGYQPAYDVANARIILQPASKKFEASVWMKNALDNHYFRNVAITGASGLSTPGDPRTVGGTLQFNFR